MSRRRALCRHLRARDAALVLYRHQQDTVGHLIVPPVPEIVHVGGLNGPPYRKTHWKRSAAKPPTFSRSFIKQPEVDAQQRRAEVGTLSEALRITPGFGVVCVWFPGWCEA